MNTMELNARVASAIGTPVMMALDARNDSTAESLVNSAVLLELLSCPDPGDERCMHC